MATYPINDENPPTGAGYRPGDIVVCPPGSVVPRWKYVGDEQWVPANVVEFVENEVTGGIEFSGAAVGSVLGDLVEVSAINLGSNERITGSRKAVIESDGTEPAAIEIEKLSTGQLLDSMRLRAKSGAPAHNAIRADFTNNTHVKDVLVTGYKVAAVFDDCTSPCIESSAMGAGCDVAVETTGATNDGVFQNNVIAYPIMCGYHFQAGAQANVVIGGETATADGGTPIVIDRANSTSVINHNTESQPTGGTPRAFYEIGCSGIGAVSVSSAGAGYTDGTHELVVTGGDGHGFRAKAVVSSGSVASAKIVSAGYAYTTLPSLSMPSSAGDGLGATFLLTLSTTTGTHNTTLKNINIIANKGNVADAVRVATPVFGFNFDQIRINATKITNSIVKLFTTNGYGKVSDINVSSRPAGVCDVEISASSGYFAGGRYTLNGIWDFLFNKGWKVVIAGAQARSYFPAAAPTPILDIDAPTDALVGVLAMRSRNGDPHATTYDPTIQAGPVRYNNAVSGGRITIPTRKRLKYTGEFSAVVFIRATALNAGFSGIAQRYGGWVLRFGANSTTLPQVLQAQATIGGSTYSISSSANVSSGTWIMAVIRRSTAEGRLYIHVGESVSYVTSVPATAMDGSTGVRRLFNRDGSASGSFIGDIAAYYEYDDLLTVGEIRYLYETMQTTLSLPAWTGGDAASSPGTDNLVLKIDPAAYVAGNFPTVPDSSGLGYDGYFGASKGPLITSSISATNGQTRCGNGVDLEGSPWRDYGILDDDPSTPSDGDSWIRGDLTPPERRVRVAGVVYSTPMSAV